MKKELKVGDRVRVYGWVNMHHSPYTPRYGGPARVTYVDDAGQCHVEFDNECGIHYTAHPKQCRRLRKRERSEQRERLVRWVNIYADGSEHFHPNEKRAKEWGLESLPPGHPEKCVSLAVRLVELRAGEAVVSRADLARAWGEVFAAFKGKPELALDPDASLLPKLCAALGLEESK